MNKYDTLSNDQLSAEVARRLFPEQCVGCYEEPLERCPSHGRNRRFYADDHNAAMGLVVAEMRKRGWLFKLEGAAPGLTDATFWSLKPGGWVIKSAQVSEGEEPRGICLAALSAKDAEEAS